MMKIICKQILLDFFMLLKGIECKIVLELKIIYYKSVV